MIKLIPNTQRLLTPDWHWKMVKKDCVYPFNSCFEPSVELRTLEMAGSLMAGYLDPEHFGGDSNQADHLMEVKLPKSCVRQLRPS